ncbi:MAG: hypothetical protein OXI25_07490 [Chloroflexota bacterium]|nr:hypothetical protein [Chloroflexota bacterium]
MAVAWVRTVEESEATGELAALYEEARQRLGRVPPMIKALSLRPKVAAAKENLRQSLIGDASSLGARRADMISVAVSGLNRCRF